MNDHPVHLEAIPESISSDSSAVSGMIESYFGNSDVGAHGLHEANDDAGEVEGKGLELGIMDKHFQPRIVENAWGTPQKRNHKTKTKDKSKDTVVVPKPTPSPTAKGTRLKSSLKPQELSAFSSASTKKNADEKHVGSVQMSAKNRVRFATTHSMSSMPSSESVENLLGENIVANHQPSHPKQRQHVEPQPQPSKRRTRPRPKLRSRASQGGTVDDKSSAHKHPKSKDNKDVVNKVGEEKKKGEGKRRKKPALRSRAATKEGGRKKKFFNFTASQRDKATPSEHAGKDQHLAQTEKLATSVFSSSSYIPRVPILMVNNPSGDSVVDNDDDITRQQATRFKFGGDDDEL
eukprot:m.190812 g.190812  ORF g.190812 m.190812 type:complete len:348 (-) comp13643_c1_seq5:1368-2411(-)